MAFPFCCNELKTTPAAARRDGKPLRSVPVSKLAGARSMLPQQRVNVRRGF